MDTQAFRSDRAALETLARRAHVTSRVNSSADALKLAVRLGRHIYRLTAAPRGAVWTIVECVGLPSKVRTGGWDATLDRVNPVQSSSESAVELEVNRGPTKATIEWLPKTYSLAGMQGVAGGGVYIVRNLHGTILKVGETDNYGTRASQYKQLNTSKGPLRFFLGRVRTWGDTAGVRATVEHALVRIFLRSGMFLRSHDRPRRPFQVTGPITIRNILPQPLGRHLAAAYASQADRAGPYRLPADAGRGHLSLTPASHPRWELQLWH